MDLVETPFFFPALTIGGRAGGPVVDTGYELAAGGRVYLDRFEAIEVGRHFSLQSAEESIRKDQRIAMLEAENGELRARLRRIGELVSAEVLSL